MADELMIMLDAHLAWQTARRSSAGTLIVEWDGRGEPRVHRRPSPPHSPTPPLSPSPSPSPSPETQPWRIDSVHSRRPPPRRATVSGEGNGDATLRVGYSDARNVASGFDPDTRFAYEYDGSLVHIHASPPQSPVSAYFDVDVESYRPSLPIAAAGRDGEAGRDGRRGGATRKALPSLPPETAAEAKKHKVVSFVKKLLGKLEHSGVLGRMRRAMERGRRTGGWVGAGYIT